MDIPQDFAGKVGELSSSTPREAIANLLSALLPRVRATTRPPVPIFIGMDLGMETTYSPDPMRNLARLRSPRTRSPRGQRSYTVVSTRHSARAGTKRARQLEIVLSHTDTASARMAGAEPRDFTYAEEIGCITFDQGERHETQ